MEIRGAVALITGAGRGIGRAIALELARAGARITAVSRTASELDTLVAEAQGMDGQIQAFPADLLAPAAAAAAVAASVKAHGRLQIVVNNAGIGGFANLAETTDAEWDEIIATNLTAVFRVTREALPHLTQGGGHIFMISSLAGSNAIAGMATYCASKAGLDHLSRCLMLEVRQQGVKVTTIAPGSVDTGFGGGKHDDASWMLKPEDIARTVVDLLRARDEAHLSRVEMRPARPQPRS
jgi:NAD(P)-dependent dehydrogenase (short-subunit alcohol dehydrogenase family)